MVWFNERCVLSCRAKQIEYKVWSPSRTQAAWEVYRVARPRAKLVYINMVNEHSRNRANHS